MNVATLIHLPVRGKDAMQESSVKGNVQEITMRYVLLVCATVIVFSGCAAIQDYHYCFVNHRRAASAWKATYPRPDRRSFSSDYEHGWKSGYFDVSTGGCGEPPVIPPNKYWSTRYQSDSGQAAVEDWYTGFQDGAIAAEGDGSGAFHWIPTGPTVPLHPVDWPAYEVDGTMIVPADEGLSSADGSQHFLQPFEPMHAWPQLPVATRLQPVATSAETFEAMPEPFGLPRNVLRAPAPVPARVAVPVPAEVKALALPAAKVNTVAPVITEE
jgi:hypothetical protein